MHKKDGVFNMQHLYLFMKISHVLPVPFIDFDRFCLSLMLHKEMSVCSIFHSNSPEIQNASMQQKTDMVAPLVVSQGSMRMDTEEKNDN